jgi:hypothetical protein
LDLKVSRDRILGSDRARILGEVIANRTVSGEEKMNLSKNLFSLTVATLGLLALPSAARAFSLSAVDNDYDFNALNPNLSFVAEGRFGNNARNGDYELDIHGVDTSNPTRTQDQANFTWTNGLLTEFSLTFDALTRAVTYIVGGQTLNATANSNPINDIFIRTRAATADTSILLSNLFLNGVDLLGSSLADNADDGVEYLRISGVSDSFTLTGTSLMSWTDSNMPRNSRLAYQIKVGSADGGAEAVPEPVSILGLALGGSGLAMMRRKRNLQKS